MTDLIAPHSLALSIPFYCMAPQLACSLSNGDAVTRCGTCIKIRSTVVIRSARLNAA